MVYNTLNPVGQNPLNTTGVYMEVEGISPTYPATGVPGDSIQVNSFVFAGITPGTLTGVHDTRSSRIQVSDVVVEKIVDDKVTPALWHDFFTNTRINRVTFYVMSPTEEGTIELQVTIRLDTVYISSLVNSFTTTSSEQISFRFDTLTMEFASTGQYVTYTFGR